MTEAAKVSVCMPYWNDAATAPRALVKTVASLIAHYPDAQLSLCDDGSLVPLVGFEAIETVVTRLPAKGIALNPCVPINCAVRASSRPIVILTNPGMQFFPGLIEEMLDSHADASTYVAAAVRDRETGRWLVHSSLGPGEGRWPVPPGAGFHHMALLSRSLWDASGGFDEAYRDGQAFDDNDFLWRLWAIGAKFVIRDDLVLDHDRSTTAWPEGGWERNRAIFESKWGKQWQR